MNAQPSTPPADPSNRRKVTVPDLSRMKASGDKIAMITAYDATFARLVDLAGIDVILVGDSVGMVVQGVSNTIPVDLDEMAYHVRIVARARTKALVVGDLPFGSYQASPEQAFHSAARSPAASRRPPPTPRHRREKVKRSRHRTRLHSCTNSNTHDLPSCLVILRRRRETPSEFVPFLWLLRKRGVPVRL